MPALDDLLNWGRKAAGEEISTEPPKPAGLDDLLSFGQRVADDPNTKAIAEMKQAEVDQTAETYGNGLLGQARAGWQSGLHKIGALVDRVAVPIEEYFLGPQDNITGSLSPEDRHRMAQGLDENAALVAEQAVGLIGRSEREFG
jgi:hypothetical protein